jgi:hypothetical protein
MIRAEDVIAAVSMSIALSEGRKEKRQPQNTAGASTNFVRRKPKSSPDC